MQFFIQLGINRAADGRLNLFRHFQKNNGDIYFYIVRVFWSLNLSLFRECTGKKQLLEEPFSQHLKQATSIVAKTTAIVPSVHFDQHQQPDCRIKIIKNKCLHEPKWLNLEQNDGSWGAYLI